MQWAGLFLGGGESEPVYLPPNGPNPLVVNMATLAAIEPSGRAQIVMGCPFVPNTSMLARSVWSSQINETIQNGQALIFGTACGCANGACVFWKRI